MYTCYICTIIFKEEVITLGRGHERSWRGRDVTACVCAHPRETQTCCVFYCHRTVPAELSGKFAQLVKHFPHKFEDLSSVPRTHLKSQPWWQRLVILEMGRERSSPVFNTDLSNFC